MLRSTGMWDDIASTNLQSRIAELVTSVGVTVGSTESLPAEVRGGYRCVYLRYTLSGPYGAFVNLIAKLEAATPPLVIENLHIQGVSIASFNGWHVSPVIYSSRLRRRHGIDQASRAPTRRGHAASRLSRSAENGDVIYDECTVFSREAVRLP